MIWLVLASALLINVLGALVWKFRTERNNCIENYNILNEKLDKITNTLASIRVKHGQTWEKWIPHSKKFEEAVGKKENAIFVGMPIDFIHFDEDKITFVEIKTGNARLSQKQRNIKHLVNEKQIYWVEITDDLE
jgi:predicted Holliday junction resolvase-like endonuclease